jgi:hypothetical protein
MLLRTAVDFLSWSAFPFHKILKKTFRFHVLPDPFPFFESHHKIVKRFYTDNY